MADLDIAGLETALPAATETATTGDANALVAADVFVADTPRQTSTTDPEAWWEPSGELEQVGQGLGVDEVAYPYILHIYGTLSRTEMMSLAARVRLAFHGRLLPAAVTGLRRAEVRAVGIADTEGGTARDEILLDIAFYGEQDRA